MNSVAYWLWNLEQSHLNSPKLAYLFHEIEITIVLVFYCCVAHPHKPGFNSTLLLSHSSWGQEFRHVFNWVFYLGSYKAAVSGLAMLCSHLEVWVRKSSLPSLFCFVGTCLWLFEVLARYWLEATLSF